MKHASIALGLAAIGLGSLALASTPSGNSIGNAVNVPGATPISHHAKVGAAGGGAQQGKQVPTPTNPAPTSHATAHGAGTLGSSAH